MIWMSWRQFRAQALVGAAALVVLAGYLLWLGTRIRDSRDGYLDRCRPHGDCAQAMGQFVAEHQNTLLILAGLLGLLPGILGMFWGAPLVARELDAGTHRLVWNQSISRRRWLLTRLLVVGLAGATMVGLVSLLLTWAASPVDAVADDRFSTVVFGARNIAPIGYALFAVTLGTVLGLLARRTLPAMALTIGVFAVVQFGMPNLVRPYLMEPVDVTRPMTAEAINEARGLGSISGAAVVRGLTVPDAWVTRTSELRTADGRTLDAARFDDCLMRPPRTGATGTFGDSARCLGELDLHVDLSYQPNHRYWPFQWLESAIYLALSALLTVFGLWRIQRRVG
ncbi:transmembrane transport protein [Plantactinospora sp. BC1]|uniref:ABC transporter permease subunit n=1 Tax=Plantactinospora sp. BC1 TaxID=2108470 RepID=UPI000D15579C|nr:ABC transporter permease subunit [Plantactinospora sp. BC1]AVT28711.1 transmembrane transport protein [Plantactinospora sp. BC1]